MHDRELLHPSYESRRFLQDYFNVKHVTLECKPESKLLYRCKKSCALLLLSSKINTYSGGLARNSSHFQFLTFKIDNPTPGWLQGIHVLLAIKSLQFSCHLQVADTYTIPHALSMQTNRFFLPKHLHMCPVALTSCIPTIHGIIKFLHIYYTKVHIC